LPGIPRAGFRLVPHVTVPSTTSSVPRLKTQQPAYIERQLAAFAQGFARTTSTSKCVPLRHS
jgi:cytochrome c553